jgi:hypothetical protein
LFITKELVSISFGEATFFQKLVLRQKSLS